MVNNYGLKEELMIIYIQLNDICIPIVTKYL